MPALLRWVCVLLIAVPALAGAAHAQSGYITGTVTDAVTGASLTGVRVVLTSAAGAISASTATDDAGQYRISDVSPGTYTLGFTRIGFAPLTVGSVRVSPGMPSIHSVEMMRHMFEFNPVVVAASRTEQTVLDVPASVYVVNRRRIEERPSLTVVDHLKSLPGLDISTGGIVQSNVVARGFNNAFSGSLLTLIDYRFASVPSLRVNVPALFPTTMSDIDRVEVVLGPAAALYGPNSANGVLAIFTRSPFESRGSTLTLEAGDKGIFKGAFRNAGVLGDKLGYKVSLEKLTGNDFRYFDPFEPDSALRPPEPGQQRVRTDVNRDFSVERTAGELRLDYRPMNETELIGSYGYSNLGRGIELTGPSGAAQARDWTMQHAQLRLRHHGFFAQAFTNFSDAGNRDSLDNRGTFLLQSGNPIVDKSRILALQAQQAWNPAGSVQLTAGADFIRTEPRTQNTINGRNEPDDEVTEWGAYVHSLTSISPRFDLVAALRTDRHSIMDEQVFSPRAGIVFKPSRAENWRLTYNRAFFTPANFTYFLDYVAIPQIHPALPYSVRTLGNKGGFTYRRDCAQGVQNLCMKSPFSTAPNTFVDAGGTALYRSGLAVVGPAVQAALTQQVGAEQAATIMQFLQSRTPTNEQVGGRLTLFSAASRTFEPFLATWSDIRSLEPETYDVIELGYKRAVENKVRIGLDVWFQRRKNFTGPAGFITPSVFVTPEPLAAYLTAELTPVVGAESAAQLAGMIAGGLAPVPLGTVAPDDPLADSPDLRVSYFQVRESHDLYGADLGLDYLLSSSWGLSATYSWVSENVFPEVFGSGIDPLTLNAPDNKATLAVSYRNETRGVSAEVRGRYANTFPASSGYYQGTVPVNAFLDFTGSYRPPSRRSMLFSISVTNVLDNTFDDPQLGVERPRPTFVGVPGLGRLVTGRLQISF